tara:strand:+ start:501 stop:833 length:333 start_codon:yes stop_codon:yes gene_type:complete
MPPDGEERPTCEEIEHKNAIDASIILSDYNKNKPAHKIVQTPIYGYVSKYDSTITSEIDEFKTIKMQIEALELLIPLMIHNDDNINKTVPLIVSSIKNEINNIELFKNHR